MGSDENVDVPFLAFSMFSLIVFGSEESARERRCDGKIGHALAESFIVLHGEHGRRNEDSDLFFPSATALKAARIATSVFP